MEAYLDNSATTRPSRQVVEAMRREMEEGYYNPSSLYRPAMEAEKRLASCRRLITDSLHAPQGAAVYFTGSGTEADNLAILGRMAAVRRPARILYLAVEHPAVREACIAAKRYGHEVLPIPVDRRGVLDMAALQALLTEQVALICVMQVNNETGAVQPIGQVAALRDRYCPGAALHVDGVQGYLRLPFDMKALGVQSYALSGHKIHGPKGVGALVLAGDSSLQPLIYGGGQEQGLRSGTENTPGIAGLEAAISGYPKDGFERLAALKKRLYEGIAAEIPTVAVNGPALADEAGAPHILNLSLPPVRSDTLLYALEGSGVYVSSGSACSSHKQKISPVLKAMGTPAPLAQSALRFSLSVENTQDEMDYAARQVAAHYRLLSHYTRR